MAQQETLESVWDDAWDDSGPSERFLELQRLVRKHLEEGRTIFDAMYEQSGVIYSIGEYSDMYKDAYGFRPRSGVWRDATAPNIPYPSLTTPQRLAVDSNDPWIRTEAADNGLALERLMSDPDPLVRTAVAGRGYALDVLIHDETPRYGTWGQSVAMGAQEFLDRHHISLDEWKAANKQTQTTKDTRTPIATDIKDTASQNEVGLER